MSDSTLKLKITTPITYNRYRLVAIDYVMVLTDPHENIVFIDIIKDRSRSYTAESSVTFSKKIPEDWLNGEYLIEIYSYDRVDYDELSIVDFDIYDKDESINDLRDFYDDPSDGLLEDLEVLKSRSDANIVKDRLYFHVDKNSNPCKIQTLSISHSVVPLNSTLQIIADVENTVPYQKEVSYQLLLNNKPIESFDLIMGPGEWKHLTFEISDPQPGENQVSVGTKEMNFVVSEVPLGPIQLVYMDIFTDRQRLYMQDPFNISVTIMNTGSKGRESVFISLDNIEISKDIEINFGETKTIDFEVLLNESGTYQAQIIGTEISKVLFVQEAPDEISSGDKEGIAGYLQKNSKFILLISVITGLIILMLGLLIYSINQQKKKNFQPSDMDNLEDLI